MKANDQLSQQDFERIESYLLNRMSENDKLDFLRELKNNKTLNEEVAKQRVLMDIVEVGTFKEKLEELHKKTIVRRERFIWWAAAASVVVLLTVGFWLVNKPTANEKLFAANFSVEPGLPVPMSAVDQYMFYDGMVDYKSGEYRLAREKWIQLLNKSPENDTLNYFIGVTFFNEEQYLQAENYLIKVIELDSKRFSGESEWYLALGYLINNETEKLKQLATTSQTDYAQKINQLINKLE